MESSVQAGAWSERVLVVMRLGALQVVPPSVLVIAQTSLGPRRRDSQNTQIRPVESRTAAVFPSLTPSSVSCIAGAGVSGLPGVNARAQMSTVPVRFELFPHGRHGLGLALDQPGEVQGWTDLLLTWLQSQWGRL